MDGAEGDEPVPMEPVRLGGAVVDGVLLGGGCGDVEQHRPVQAEGLHPGEEILRRPVGAGGDAAEALELPQGFPGNPGREGMGVEINGLQLPVQHQLSNPPEAWYPYHVQLL